MYPSGDQARSTTSEQENKWWLDDENEEKPGVTPANDHLAKRPDKTLIYSREEMEALAEEKLRYVVDIDDKKDFLDIIKSAMALKSSLLVAKNQAESQRGTLPLGLFILAIPYSDQELVNLSCLVDRGREFKVDTESCRIAGRNPSTRIVHTGHTLLQPRVGKPFLFGRSWP
jgi:hypothetical protein